MLASSRFVVAVHALSILACYAGKGPVCSATIAKSVHTNPVVIRRLMGALERANLVKSTAGRAGGFELVNPANQITLADVYNAVEDESVFRLHNMDPESDCPVAARMGKALGTPLRNAALAMNASLKTTTLSDVADALQ